MHHTSLGLWVPEPNGKTISVLFIITLRLIKQESIESSASMDDTIQRVFTKCEEFRQQRSKERRRREQIKCCHLCKTLANNYKY